MASDETLVSPIVRLARTISESATKIDSTLAARGLDPISFDENLPFQRLPEDLSSARDMLLDATNELQHLLLEPAYLIRTSASINTSVCIQAIARYRIATIVPPGGTISFTDISKKTKLEEDLIRRLLRFAMTMKIFREPEPGFVAHTKTSMALSSPEIVAWTLMGTEEGKTAASRMLEAWEKWPGSQEHYETGFVLADPSNRSIYDVLATDADKAAQFGAAMTVFANSPDYAASHLVHGYDWAGLSKKDNGRVQVVDLGGGRGDIAMALTEQYPDLEILVQDMEKMVEGAETRVPDQLKDRIRFQAHDIFTPQPSTADVYLFRWIMHNWGDKYCIAMLRQLIPVLKPGCRIIVMETCMPEPGNSETRPVPNWMERDMRFQDLNMMALFNAKERTLNEWKRLFTDADPKFKFISISQPEGSAFSIMELEWST